MDQTEGFKPFATIEDIESLFRTLNESEKSKANSLLPVVSDSLRQEAKKEGKDLDEMLLNNEVYPNVLKSVTVDIVARTLLTSTTDEPMQQMSQSALGYSVSGTFLVPGGGLFIKRSELARIGLKKQKCGAIEMFHYDKRN